MASSDREQAAILIPAAYLEAVRSALVAELADDTDMLRTNQTALQSGGCREDVDSAVRLLSQDLRALQSVLDAEQDTEITTERETLFSGLGSMCRLTVDRLKDEMTYEPLDMLKVLQLTERLHWAAAEATRICPEMAVA